MCSKISWTPRLLSCIPSTPTTSSSYTICSWWGGYQVTVTVSDAVAESGWLRIATIEGKQVYEKPFSSSNSNQLVISTVSWPRGMYLAEWTSSEGRKYTRKIVLQ